MKCEDLMEQKIIAPIQLEIFGYCFRILFLKIFQKVARDKIFKFLMKIAKIKDLYI